MFLIFLVLYISSYNTVVYVNGRGEPLVIGGTGEFLACTSFVFACWLCMHDYFFLAKPFARFFFFKI